MIDREQIEAALQKLSLAELQEIDTSLSDQEQLKIAIIEDLTWVLTDNEENLEKAMFINATLAHELAAPNPRDEDRDDMLADVPRDSSRTGTRASTLNKGG